MGEEGVEERAEHTALWHAGVQCYSGGGEVVDPNRLWSVSEEIQCPITEGGGDAKTAEFGDQASGYESVKGGAEVNKQQPEPEIYGYTTDTTINKISLYADDVLIYITKPEISIPNLLNVITKFGAFSGYRINWNKTEIMPITGINLNTLQQYPLKIVTDKFKYLGINVTLTHNSIIKSNYPQLLDKLRKNISYWKTLPISMIGRISAIKMVFLPQLLYLFQAIPFFLPKT